MAKSLVQKLGDGFGRTSGSVDGPAEAMLIGGVDPAPAGLTDEDLVVDRESAREIGAMLRDPVEFFAKWPDLTRRAYNLNNLCSVIVDGVIDPVNLRIVAERFVNSYEGRHRVGWTRLANLLTAGKLLIPGTEAAVAEARQKRGTDPLTVPGLLEGRMSAEEAARINALLNSSRRVPTVREHFAYVVDAMTRADAAKRRAGGKGKVDVAAVLASIGLTGIVSVPTATRWAELHDADDSVLDAMFEGRITAAEAVQIVKAAPGKLAQQAAIAALPAKGEGRITATLAADTAKAATAAIAEAKDSGTSPKAAAKAAAKDVAAKRPHLTLRDLRKLLQSGKGSSAAHRAVRGVFDMLTMSPDDLSAEQIAAVPGLAEYLAETAPDAE